MNAETLTRLDYIFQSQIVPYMEAQNDEEAFKVCKVFYEWMAKKIIVKPIRAGGKRIVGTTEKFAGALSVMFPELKGMDETTLTNIIQSYKE